MSENPYDLFGWNWMTFFDEQQWPYCTIRFPNEGLIDLQLCTEYVVYSIRKMYKYNQKNLINIIAHSSGGILVRFGLRFWPDIRQMIDDLISHGPSNHGTYIANIACFLPIGCAPAVHQQRVGSNFLDALNSHQETFDSISYTTIMTKTDEIIRPVSSSELHNNYQNDNKSIINIYLQNICPYNLYSEHLAIGTYDYCAYQLTLDALQHQGPTNLERIQNCCEQTLMPVVTSTWKFLINLLYLMKNNAVTLFVYKPRINYEPQLKCSFTNTCS
ncbi:unnamed protein product [Didymodactylos carnosus]|nr:unnamed protein product [Didymodactylos carnosus]CAF3739823.1 unnamed protein product [Didymodactylos carnosus]